MRVDGLRVHNDKRRTVSRRITRSTDNESDRGGFFIRHITDNETLE